MMKSRFDRFDCLGEKLKCWVVFGVLEEIGLED
jgi:hypothetical protein